MRDSKCNGSGGSFSWTAEASAVPLMEERFGGQLPLFTSLLRKWHGKNSGWCIFRSLEPDFQTLGAALWCISAVCPSATDCRGSWSQIWISFCACGPNSLYLNRQANAFVLSSWCFPGFAMLRVVHGDTYLSSRAHRAVLTAHAAVMTHRQICDTGVKSINLSWCLTADCAFLLTSKGGSPREKANSILRTHISLLLWQPGAVNEPSGPHLMVIPIWSHINSFVPLLPNSRVGMVLENKACQAAPPLGLFSAKWSLGLMSNCRFWSLSPVQWPQEVIHLGLGLQPVWSMAQSNLLRPSSAAADRWSLAQRPSICLIRTDLVFLAVSVRSFLAQPSLVSAAPHNHSRGKATFETVILYPCPSIFFSCNDRAVLADQLFIATFKASQGDLECIY